MQVELVEQVADGGELECVDGSVLVWAVRS